MSTFFNRYDFANLNFEPELTQDEVQHIADVANAKLGQAGVRVYSSEDVDDGEAWETTKYVDASHTALLIDVQPIEQEPCKHEPRLHEGWFDAKSDLLYCKHCGTPLRATWSAVEEGS